MGSEPNVRRGTEEDAEVLARLLRRFNDEYEEETPDHEILLERIPDLIASGDGVFFLAGEDRDRAGGIRLPAVQPLPLQPDARRLPRRALRGPR